MSLWSWKLPSIDETLQMIKETPKVTGFVGGGAQPTPLTNEEVAELLKQVDAGSAGPREQVKFIKTDNVRIVDGPFLGFQRRRGRGRSGP